MRGPNLASRTKSFAIPVTSVYLKEHKTRHQQRPFVLRPRPLRCHIQMAHPQRSSARGQGNHHSVAHLLSKLKEPTGGEDVYELGLIRSHVILAHVLTTLCIWYWYFLFLMKLPVDRWLSTCILKCFIPRQCEQHPRRVMPGPPFVSTFACSTRFAKVSFDERGGHPGHAVRHATVKAT